jgi:glycosyltransferase involved in cell wall biosynthesis
VGAVVTSEFSVVIPAWNEERVIGRTLDRLLRGLGPDDDVEVVVICNGCTDRTADVARERGDRVKVVETPVGSKSHALNLGDAVARAFPRIYLDADVELDTADARILAQALREPGAQAASPSLHVDYQGAGMAVRSYSRIWSELPSIRTGLAGRGVYAVSSAGRARFEHFPDLMADDRYIHLLFSDGSGRCVPEARVTVHLPDTAWALIKRKARVFAANQELAAHLELGGAVAQDRTGRFAWMEVVRADARRVVDVPAYLLVTLGAKLRARLLMRGSSVAWGERSA